LRLPLTRLFHLFQSLPNRLLKRFFPEGVFFRSCLRLLVANFPRPCSGWAPCSLLIFKFLYRALICLSSPLFVLFFPCFTNREAMTSSPVPVADTSHFFLTAPFMFPRQLRHISSTFQSVSLANPQLPLGLQAF